MSCITIGHLPGTLGATKYLGSQPKAHGAVSMTSGSLQRSAVQFGSMGTISSATHVSASTGSNFAAPAKVTRVEIVARVPANTGGVAITQRRRGTIAFVAGATVAVANSIPVWAFIHTTGTWNVRFTGAGGPGTTTYREAQPR